MKIKILLLLSICLLVFSCTSSHVSTNSEVTVSNEAGTKEFSFEPNKQWTAESSEGWCTVSPTRGNASTKSITVTISENDTDSSRSCNVTITEKGRNSWTHTFRIYQTHFSSTSNSR